jgi:hypothetical protein
MGTLLHATARCREAALVQSAHLALVVRARLPGHSAVLVTLRRAACYYLGSRDKKLPQIKSLFLAVSFTLVRGVEGFARIGEGYALTPIDDPSELL